MPVIALSDFTNTGRVRINQFQNAEFIRYIERYSKQGLVLTLGNTLYNLFVNDLDVNGVPQNLQYLSLFNEIDLTNCNCECADCKSQPFNDGMKDALMDYVSFYYERSRMKRSTSTGKRKVDNENSSNYELTNSDVITVYNSSIDSFRVIQKKAKELGLITDCVKCPNYILNV